jgi:hypothetical protein
MQGRFAFTAKYWGDAAVVCRAVVERPGPVVEQEFAQFDSWTQANQFAARLNEGLEVHPTEAKQIVTSSILRSSELLRQSDSPDQPRGPVAKRSLHVQFILAELDLAAAFCRLVPCKPRQHTERMLRNARKALFNAMHYVAHSELAGCDLQEITARLQGLHSAFGGSAPQPVDASFARRREPRS